MNTLINETPLTTSSAPLDSAVNYEEIGRGVFESLGKLLRESVKTMVSNTVDAGAQFINHLKNWLTGVLMVPIRKAEQIAFDIARGCFKSLGAYVVGFRGQANREDQAVLREALWNVYPGICRAIGIRPVNTEQPERLYSVVEDMRGGFLPTLRVPSAKTTSGIKTSIRLVQGVPKLHQVWTRVLDVAPRVFGSVVVGQIVASQVTKWLQTRYPRVSEYALYVHGATLCGVTLAVYDHGVVRSTICMMMATGAYLAARAVRTLGEWMYQRVAPRLLVSARRQVSIMSDNSSDKFTLRDALRMKMRTSPLPEARSTGAHQHPVSAASRSLASQFIVKMIESCGLRPYMYQKSSADIKHQLEGSRSYYWAKDVAVDATEDVLTPQHVICMVDVDYYVDMPWFIREHMGLPIMLYTLTPEAVSRVGKEHSFMFNDSGEVVYKLAGGSQFVHRVWNYSIDSYLCVDHLFGMPFRACVYNVDVRKIGEDRSLVLFTPVKSWGVRGAWTTMMLEDRVNAIDRLNVVVKAKRGNGEETLFTRLRVRNGDTETVSTGRPGQLLCATVRATDDDAIATAARTGSLKLNAATVKTYLPAVNPLDGKDWAERGQHAQVLLEYHLCTPASEPPLMILAESANRGYQYAPKFYDQSAKPSMKPFMQPIVHGAFAPDMTVWNNAQGIWGRVLKFQNRDIKVTPFILQCMDEWLSMVEPVPHVVEPYDIDEVYDRMNRPTQRRLLMQEDMRIGSGAKIVKPFTKKEAYPKVSDERKITPVDQMLATNLARYAYAINDHIKRCARAREDGGDNTMSLSEYSWYASGRTPKEIAESIADIAIRSSFIVCADASRMDGHKSVLGKILTEKRFLRMFKPEYHAEILDLLSRAHDRPAVTEMDLAYFTYNAEFSGIHITSLNNGDMDDLYHYVAWRTVAIGGDFLPPLVAFRYAARSALILGDDAIQGVPQTIMGCEITDASFFVKALEKAGKMMGHELDIAVFPRGSAGANFLSRIYGSGVWEGDPSSMCDVLRQLKKLHVTVALPPDVSAERKLLEKCRAYALTDPRTPIIGEIARKALELHPYDEDESVRQIRPWYGEYPSDAQYPQYSVDWMYEYLRINLDEPLNFDYQLFNRWLDSAKSLTDLLKAPVCASIPQPSNKQDVVVDGDVVKGTEPSEQPKLDAIVEISGRSGQFAGVQNGAVVAVNSRGQSLDGVQQKTSITKTQAGAVQRTVYTSARGRGNGNRGRGGFRGGRVQRGRGGRGRGTAM